MIETICDFYTEFLISLYEVNSALEIITPPPPAEEKEKAD